MKKHTVLFLEWSTKGREFEMDFPLMYFFENYLGWNVEYKCSFNLPSILKMNPDIIILSSTGGACTNLKLSRWAEKSNILVFSSFTEGMFREQDIGEFLWGWNKEQKYSEELRMVWSQKAYNMSVKHFPKVQVKLRMSGSIGFDKYKLLNYKELDKCGYKKVIGYAAFDFNNIMDKKDYFIKTLGEEKFNTFIELINNANEILEYIIKNNKDILFLLKPHPGDGVREPLELKGLLEYPNTKIIDNKTSIVEVIATSDIWLNINSSTNLEAWLLDKPSISFLTDESRFSSDVLYGSILENDYIKIQTYIEEHYKLDKIQAFEEKKDLRKKLISDYIGFSDGLNHIRYMSFLKPYIDKIEQGNMLKGKWNIPFKAKVNEYIRHIVYRIADGKYKIPFLKKWAKIYDIFKLDDINKFQKEQYPYIDKFYKENKQKIDDIYINKVVK